MEFWEYGFMIYLSPDERTRMYFVYQLPVLWWGDAIIGIIWTESLQEGFSGMELVWRDHRYFVLNIHRWIAKVTSSNMCITWRKQRIPVWRCSVLRQSVLVEVKLQVQALMPKGAGLGFVVTKMLVYHVLNYAIKRRVRLNEVSCWCFVLAEHKPYMLRSTIHIMHRIDHALV